MESLPVAIESSAQRDAVAAARAELRRVRVAPWLWSTRILVWLVGVPVALVGVSVGLLMARQDQNDNALAIAALTSRIERRVVECIAQSEEPVPAAVRVDVLHAEDAHLTCAGDCPALACMKETATPLVRQAPLGFAATIELDLSTDRILARDAVLALVAGALADTPLSARAASDGLSYELRCAGTDGTVDDTIAQVPATFRPRLDRARILAAAERESARCAR